jgi:hypothetical protein
MNRPLVQTRFARLRDDKIADDGYVLQNAFDSKLTFFDRHGIVLQ